MYERGNDSSVFLRDVEEMSWGIYEGMPRNTRLTQAFGEMKEAWAAEDYEFRIQGGESVLDVQKRGVRALNYIVHRHTGKNILVVSHGRFIRILLSTILVGYNLSRMKDLKQDNTAFNQLVFSDGSYRAEKLKCIDHLTNG